MKNKTQLNISWTDLSWDVRIRNRHGGCRLDREIMRLVRSRFEPLAVPAVLYGRVSLKSRSRLNGGFTLVELLVVIAIIGILAGILLPTLSAVKTRAKVANARTEMQGLATAIKSYEGDYNRYPATPSVEQQAGTGDFTFGNISVAAPMGAQWTPNPVGGNMSNTAVVLIVLDIDQGINANHGRNPRKIKYWNPKMVSSDQGGVSTVDYVARDPFGSPYFITVDMNDDNKCVDAFYGTGVSQRAPGDNVGYYGLSRPAANAPFELNAPVMIWSPGPDKSYDINERANAGLNKDNVLSWAN